MDSFMHELLAAGGSVQRRIRSERRKRREPDWNGIGKRPQRGVSMTGRVFAQPGLRLGVQTEGPRWCICDDPRP
eukprot:6076412-Prymnesium_polylepis.1